MAGDDDYDPLIWHIEAATLLARGLNLTHAECLLRMVLLEVADTLNGGRLMRPKPKRRQRRPLS